MTASNRPPVPTAQFSIVRYFVVIVAPVFLVFVLLLVTTGWLSFEYVSERAYAMRSTRLVDAMVRSLLTTHPEEFAQLLQGATLSPDGMAALDAQLQREAADLQILSLKIFNRQERQLYPAPDGQIVQEDSTHEYLSKTLQTGEATIGHAVSIDDIKLHEIWIPLRQDGQIIGAVELYERAELLDQTKTTILTPALLPATLVAALWGVVMFFLARRMQGELNRRTDVIAELTERVERLVSHRAVSAMHAGEQVGKTMPRMISCTHLFSDVRGFTAFAERNVPTAVITTPNDIFAMQVEILERAGADIDKFVGDAVFARFEGDDRERRAIDAAISIQRTLIASGIPFEIGIGIASGNVVAGVCGVPSRYDYTVVGDPVNVASRLCGEASGGIVLIDRVTAEAAAFGGGTVEVRPVKGRVAPVEVRRVDCRAEVSA